MLNKNKKRMVKLFLLVFIILIYSYNVKGEEYETVDADCGYVCCWYDGQDIYHQSNLWVGTVMKKEVCENTRGYVLTPKPVTEHLCSQYSGQETYDCLQGVDLSTLSGEPLLVGGNRRDYCKCGDTFCKLSGGGVCKAVTTIADGNQPIVEVGQCSVWQPKGDSKCNECMSDGDCSYYECKSKGLNCAWDNGNCYIGDCVNVDEDEFCDNVDDCIDIDGDGYGDGDGCSGEDYFPEDPIQWEFVDTEPPKIVFIDDDVKNINGVDIKTIRRSLSSFSVGFEVHDQNSVSCEDNTLYTSETTGDLSYDGNTKRGIINVYDFWDNNIQLKIFCEDEDTNSAEAELVVVRKGDLYVKFQDHFNEDAITRGESGDRVDNNIDTMIVKSDRLTKCYYSLNNGNELIFPEKSCNKEDRTKTNCMWRQVHKALLNDFFTTKGIYNINIRCIDDYLEEDSKLYENIFVNIEPLNVNLNYKDNPNGESKLYQTLTGEVEGGLGTNIECKYKVLNGFDSDNAVVNEIKGWKYDDICAATTENSNLCGNINNIEKSGEKYIINQDLPEPLDGSSKYYGVICRDSENSLIEKANYVKIKDYVPSLSINLEAGDRDSYADVSIRTSGGLYNDGMAYCYYKESSVNVVNLDDSFTKISDNPSNSFNFRLPKEDVFSSGQHKYHFICVDANVEKNDDKESYTYEFIRESEAGALVFASFRCFNCEDILDENGNLIEEDVGGFIQTWALETSEGLYGNGKATCNYHCDWMGKDTNGNDIYHSFNNPENVGNSYLHKKSFSINGDVENNVPYVCKFKCDDDNKEWEQQSGVKPELKDLRLKTPELRVEDIEVVPKTMISREIIVKTSGGYDRNGKARCRITDNLLDELKDNSKDDFFNDMLDILDLQSEYYNWYFVEMDRDAKSSYDDNKLIRSHRKTVPISKEGTYSYWIQCRDSDVRGRYSTNRDRKEKRADLIQFSVDFNDLNIDITKPISGDVKGLETVVEFETRGGTNNDGDISKCEILDGNNAKAVVNRGEVKTGIYSNNKLIGRKFSIILTGLKEGPNSYQIKCYDNTYPKIIIGVADLGFNAVVESFLIDTDNLDSITNIDKAEFNWVVTTSGGIKGSGKGSCSYSIKNMNQVEVNKADFNLVKSKSETSIFSAAIDINSLNGGVYDFKLICNDDVTLLEKIHDGILISITKVNNCGEGVIYTKNVGCYCGGTKTTTNDYNKYCCGDGNLYDSKEICDEKKKTCGNKQIDSGEDCDLNINGDPILRGDKDTCQEVDNKYIGGTLSCNSNTCTFDTSGCKEAECGGDCAELNNDKTDCILNNAKCNLKCAPYCVIPDIGGVYKCTPTETQTCEFKDGNTTEGICVNDNCPISITPGFVTGQCIENELCGSDYDYDLVEDALDCNDNDINIGQCKGCAVCYQGVSVIEGSTSSDMGKCLKYDSKCSATICTDGCVGNNYVTYEQFSVPNKCSVVNNIGTCSQNNCVEKDRIVNDEECISPAVDCTKEGYDANQGTCVNAGCEWSGETYKCDTDCHTGWTDANDDKICEAPEAKQFRVTVTKPQDETTITQLPVELWVSTQKEASCSYIKGSRNVFDEFEEISEEIYNDFYSVSQNKKYFMKNLGSLQNEKYTYHVHCDALDGTNDYGNAYVDFSVNVAGDGCNLDCESNNKCNDDCATTSGCEADPDCSITPTTICENDKDCDTVLDSQDRDDNTPKGCHVDYRGMHIDKDKDNVCDCNPSLTATPQCDKCLGTISGCIPVDINDGETKGCPTFEACEKNVCVNDKYCRGAGNCGACGDSLLGINFNCPQLLCHSLGSCYWQDRLWKFDLCSDCPSDCNEFENDGGSCVNEDDDCKLDCYWDTTNNICKTKLSDGVKKTLTNCIENCDDEDGCICPNNCAKTETIKDITCGGISGVNPGDPCTTSVGCLGLLDTSMNCVDIGGDNCPIQPTITQCNDNIDNDNDNKIDYPNDPGCSSANDNDETDVITTGQVCSISSINWVNKDGQTISRANEGERVYILAEGSNCNIGDSLSYEIYEKDILVIDWAQADDLIKRDTINLQNKEGAVIEWDAVFDANDGFSPNNQYYVRISDMSSRLLETKEGCVEDWECTEWSPVVCPINGKQTRTCIDKNNCGTTNNKPALTQTCTVGAKTQLSDCNTNCINPSGCICPTNCVKTGDINNYENCEGVPGACVDQDVNLGIDSQVSGCTGSNYCDGQGTCKSMYWKYYISWPSCRPSNSVLSKCTPSRVGFIGMDIERDGALSTDSLRDYDASAPMDQIWCDQYICSIGNPTISNCQDSEPTGNGVLKGVSYYPQDYQTTTWTYKSDNGILGACEWKCDTNYVQSGNSCVASGQVTTGQVCSINSINWVNKDGQAISMSNEGETVYGIIRGTNCNSGTNINYEIKEKDMALGVDELAADDLIISSSITFPTNNVASITWQAVRQNDLADPNNWYYIKINERESSLLEVKEIVSDARKTVLEECNTNCNDPDGCTCPGGCSITGDINRRQNCGQAIADTTAPQIIQIVSKSARNYILTNENAICYASINNNGPWDNGLSREGSRKHLITLIGVYYIKCIDTAGNWGGVVSIS